MKHIVHFFGGFRASVHDVESWSNSARQRWPQAVRIGGWAWPVWANASDPLEHWPAHNTQLIVDQLLEPETLHWFVGHSSGCAMANRVADVCTTRALT